jgi:light-regulated signal transduction histidine kinase (bacteriophytochrome)
MTGRTLWDLGLLSRVQADDAFAALQASPDPHPVRAGWRARDGRDRTVAWTISAVRAGGSVRSAVAVGVDLTEQYAAEGRERRAKAALELRSHELARSSRDLAHFAMLATDELREPVRELERLAERLAHGPASARDDRLDAVRATASRTQGMLDGLADYGRLGQGEALAGDVDCERALDSALAALNAEIVARHADVTHDPLPTVAGDPDELRTLLSQLVASAVRQSGTSAPHVHVGAQRGRLGWELTVTGDRGGDRTRREFGVGMALCHRIVERHGGSLWADESPTGAKAYHVALPDRTRS